MDSWMNLGSYTLISIIVFNGGRPGELERSLLAYLEILTSINENTETFNKLSDSDRTYVKAYARFVIRGKLARGVPVLLHKSMHESINLLLKYRKEAGVAENNPYIFGLPQCRDDAKTVFRHMCSTSLIRKYSRKCGATNPKTLKGATLRKHVATKSRSLNLNNEDIHPAYSRVFRTCRKNP
ncbi:hypothetical protein JTB14_004502 [Gonioctena quinquepunctata]|nr:hypothetical protein JTB14_004502 [Gonioctena quinquepunctata]